MPTNTTKQSNQSRSSVEFDETQEVLSTLAAETFREEFPDYPGGQINSRLMQQYIADNDLDLCLVSSYARAYEALIVSGQLELPEQTDSGEPEPPEFESRPSERHLNGTVKSFHDPAKIRVLYSIDINRLKKIVNSEKSAKKARLQRLGILY